MRRKTLEQFIKDAKAVHGDKYDYSEVQYLNNHIKIKVKCNLCGSVFYITPDNLLQGRGCKYCRLGESRRILCLDGEIWKDAIGYEGLYMVSNFGRVKSLPKLSNNKRYITEEKILSPRVCGTQREYLAVALHKNEKTKQCKIHRLVAMAFIPNPEGYNEINHKDENKGNNMVDNLEWCSRSYNVNYGCGNEKRRLKQKEVVQQFTINGVLVNEYNSFAEAANAVYGCSANISHCVNGDTKKYKGFIWKRKYAKKYGSKSKKVKP